MTSTKDLRSIARARLRDAQVLLQAKRLDGAYYLSGYAVELALKARICRTLKWNGFPDGPSDFKGLQSLKTHDFATLLRFSGLESKIRRDVMTEWSVVVKWNPERRYQAIGSSTPEQTVDMLQCVERLLKKIL
jgi:HEPN domain-containing protein